MIIVEFMGGLGNQMFQYAYARMIQELYNEELYIDQSIYRSYKVRNFTLHNLNINENIKDISELNLSKLKYLSIILKRKYYRVYQKAIRILKGNDKLGESIFKRYTQKGLLFNFDRYFYNTEKIDKEVKVVYGYFQSEKYFENIRETIKKELKVKVEPSNKEMCFLGDILNCQSVAVSIRWGNDYKNTNLDVCDKDYFYRAMDLISERVTNPIFFIFSDRIDLIKQEFEFKYPVRYIEGMCDYESLRLMYSCKNFIISNSSFSWWGAYLSDNEKKITIAPDKWYKQCYDRPDIYSDFMMTIKV